MRNRKIARVALSVAMILTLVLTGCGGTAQPKATPTERVNTMMDAIRAADEDSAKKVLKVSDDVFDVEDAVDWMEEEDAEEELNAQNQQKLLSFEKALRDFEYAVTDEKVEGEKATVMLTVKTYPFGAITEAAIDDVVSEAIQLQFDGKTDEEIEEAMTNLFVEKLDAQFNKQNKRTYVKTMTLTLELNKDSEWVITGIDGDLNDALVGGFDESMTDLDVEDRMKEFN